MARSVERGNKESERLGDKEIARKRNKSFRRKPESRLGVGGLLLAAASSAWIPAKSMRE
jgi:hypothetical protein